MKFRKTIIAVIPGGGFKELIYFPNEPAGKRLMGYPLVGWIARGDAPPPGHDCLGDNCECMEDQFLEMSPLSVDNEGVVEELDDVYEREHIVGILHESEPMMSEEDAKKVYEEKVRRVEASRERARQRYLEKQKDGRKS